MFIQTENTSDEATVRFFPGVPVLEAGKMEFADAGQAAVSPLAQALLTLPDVQHVMLGVEEITVTKTTTIEWAHLKPSILGAIMEHFVAGLPVLNAEQSSPAVDEDWDREEDKELIDQLKELIQTRIAPALAEGGSVEYRGYRDGVVKLALDGIAKMHVSAITNMLKHFIPEVVSIRDDNTVTGEGLATDQGKMVQRIIDEQVNPAVASHGGFITLVDVKDNEVFVQLGGGCQGCGMANVTLKQGIETAIVQHMPEITAVLDVTEHAAGDNPYYEQSKK
jgi:Fe-S cluster biogenesis protein NfuA